MMNIFYENTKGEKIDLLKSPYRIVETDVFDSDWTETTTGYEKKIELDVVDDAGKFCGNMNELYDSLAYDAENGTYGKLWVNGSYLRCKLKSSKKTGWKGQIYAYITLTVIAPALAWVEVENREFIGATDDETTGKSYPYDYPYDYAPPKIGRVTWDIDHIKPCDFTMIINGSADNPEITINGYKYKVFTTLNDGEYMIIDSQSKTITKNVGGTIVNIFDDRNLESSVFEKINPGTNTVEWAGTFTFEIYVYKERREPRWT